MTKDKKILIGKYQRPFSVDIERGYGIGPTIISDGAAFQTIGNTDITIHLCGASGFDSEYLGRAFKMAAKMLGVAMEYDAFKPERVIFNDPATIAFWSDGTKTVAKCKDGDEFDPLFGLMACAMRKAGKNRVRIDAWEEVVTSLADSIATADECRVLADMLNATADLMDCEGAMDELAEHDARKNEEVDTSVDYKPLFSATDGSGSVQFVSRDKFGSVSEKLIEEVDRYLDESDESIVDEILAFLHNLANKEEL